jgi:hypothetical protein
MLQAPTSETKQRSSQSKANQEPQPEHELHPRLGVTATQGWASGEGIETAPTPASARGFDRWVGLHRAYGNQAVLRALSPRLQFQSALNPPNWNFSTIPVSRAPLLIQPKLEIGAVDDPLEREADEVAERVMRMPNHTAPQPHCAGTLQRKCSACEKENEQEKKIARKKVSGRATEPRTAPAIVREVLASPGHPLDVETRAFFEPRLGRDLGSVSVHSDSRAAESASHVRARAYTVGHDVVFGLGQYAPTSVNGKKLLAHELTHILQQGSTPQPMRQAPAAPEQEEREPRAEGIEVGGDVSGVPVHLVKRGGVRVSRDLAVSPTRPGAAEPVLTEEQIQAAIRYNAFRFKDPYSIAVVRDIVGVPRFPAVSDEDLALGLARYQSSFGLTPDGKAGPATTAQLVTEAGAENLPKDATQLRADNYVTWAPGAGVHNGCGAGPDAEGPTFFQWDVNFSTSLRNGWIVQELVNRWNPTTCGGAAIPEVFTPHYWEAWWVDGAGNVLVPTAINAARTQPTASVAPALAHDLWRLPSDAPSSGNWSTTAELFTCLRLPAGFAAGNVPDAGDLPSTAAALNSDDLGLVEAQRSAGGRWNCCGDPATQFHNPA